MLNDLYFARHNDWHRKPQTLLLVSGLQNHIFYLISHYPSVWTVRYPGFETREPNVLSCGAIPRGLLTSCILSVETLMTVGFVYNCLTAS